MGNTHRFGGNAGTGKAAQRQYYPAREKGEKCMEVLELKTKATILGWQQCQFVPNPAWCKSSAGRRRGRAESSLATDRTGNGTAR